MMRQYPVQFRHHERRKFHQVRWFFERRKAERRCGFDRRPIAVTEHQPAITEHTAWSEQ